MGVITPVTDGVHTMCLDGGRLLGTYVATLGSGTGGAYCGAFRSVAGGGSMVIDGEKICGEEGPRAIYSARNGYTLG
jgi:hypothetical protein